MYRNLFFLILLVGVLYLLWGCSLGVGDECQISVLPECGGLIGNSYYLCGLQGQCVNNSLTGGHYACNCTNGFTGQFCTITPCPYPCNHGFCNHDLLECICFNNWGSSGNDFCSVNLCPTGAISEPDGPTGECQCVNKSLTIGSGCTQLGCPIAPVSMGGQQCGSLNPYFQTSCSPTPTCPQSGCNCCNNGACVCNWSGFLNTTSGLCVSYCSTNYPTQTTRVDSKFIPNPDGPGEIEVFDECECAPEWSGDPFCKTLTCKNGGEFKPDGSGCVCPPGYSGPTCTLSACNNRGTYVPATQTCVNCTVPWSGSFCEVSLCLNGGSPGVNGTCLCQPTYNGTFCQIDRCGLHGWGTSNPTGTACNCLGFVTGFLCDTCPAPYTVVNCLCQCGPNTYGDACQYNRCGTGMFNTTTQSCNCPRVAKFDGAGNCTLNHCGSLGYPNPGYTECNCATNTTLIPQLNSSYSIYCIPNCMNGGVYNDSILGCQCPPYASIQPFCRFSPFSSSTGLVSSTGIPLSSTAPSNGSTGAAPSGSSSNWWTSTDAIIVYCTVGPAILVAIIVGAYYGTRPPAPPVAYTTDGKPITQQQLDTDYKNELADLDSKLQQAANSGDTAAAQHWSNAIDSLKAYVRPPAPAPLPQPPLATTTPASAPVYYAPSVQTISPSAPVATAVGPVQATIAGYGSADGDQWTSEDSSLFSSD